MRLVRMSSLVAMLALVACGKEQKQEAKAEVKAVEAPTEAPKVDKTVEAEQAALVERGAYLSELMGCEHCHTPFGPQGPDTSKRFAGGLEIPEVFGTWRSLNITQDKDTGIGAWTDEQIIAAIREGKRPNGEQLFPIMPYLFYNSLSDDDATALVAFLRTLEAVPNKLDRAMDLKMPQIPAPPPSGAAPDKSNPVAHGKYLTSMMHCAACHTPVTEQGPDMSRAFAGGMPLEIPQMFEGTLYSTNLTPHETGLKDWTDEEIAKVLREMKRRDGSLIRGPMAMYQRGWYGLADEDVAAITAFLRSLPPQENKIPESTFKPNASPK